MGLPNKQRYCDLHGYTHLPLTSGFDASRPPAWSKIKFLREHLPRFDWLFWSDIDSLITNYSIRLQDLADDNYDLIITMEDQASASITSAPAKCFSAIANGRCASSMRFTPKRSSSTAACGNNAP
jgi:hypothetical protein